MGAETGLGDHADYINGLNGKPGLGWVDGIGLGRLNLTININYFNNSGNNLTHFSNNINTINILPGLGWVDGVGLG
jgi:hypothetical protein